MTRHCRQIFSEVAAPRSGWSMSAGVCFGVPRSTAHRAAREMLAASCHPSLGLVSSSGSHVTCVLFQGIHGASSGASLTLGGGTALNRLTKQHNFWVLSPEANNPFCAHWARFYFIRAQKLFGRLRAAGCLHRWCAGCSDCGLSAAGDLCGLWAEASSSWESQNACTLSTVWADSGFRGGNRAAAELWPTRPLTQTPTHWARAKQSTTSLQGWRSCRLVGSAQFDPSATMGWVMLSQQTRAEPPHPTGTSLGTFSVKPLWKPTLTSLGPSTALLCPHLNPTPAPPKPHSSSSILQHLGCSQQLYVSLHHRSTSSHIIPSTRTAYAAPKHSYQNITLSIIWLFP